MPWPWGGWFGRPKPAAVQPLPALPPPRQDEFSRQSHGGMPSASQLVLLAATVLGKVGEHTDPETVPWYALDAMEYDPWISLGEQAFAAPLRDHTLYYFEHDDPAIVAEAEAWFFRPRLCSPLLRYITGAFSMGLSIYVADWTAEDLTIKVPSKSGGEPRNKNLPAHQHYVTFHEIHPGEADELRAQADRLLWVRYAGNTYRTDQAFVSVNGERYGRWRGQSSRRRAWKAYYKGEFVDLWQGRWLERGVDPPRIAYAPDGLIELNGTKIAATDLMAAAIHALKGGGTAVLPFKPDDKGNQAWSVSPMELPDVHDTWHRALDQCASAKLIASLVPPSTAGVSDTTFAGARVPNDMFVELLEEKAQWTADQISAVLEVPHRINHGDKIRPPLCKAREIPRTKIKRLLEVFKTAATVARRVEDGKEVTFAELLDESILDEIGVPRRPTADAARPPRSPEAGAPGRKKDELGGREERREVAREPEGEDAVGGPDEQVSQ